MEGNEMIDTDEVFTVEDTYRLALESIVRWTDRSFDTEFQDSLIVRAISKVAQVALDEK